MARLVSTDITVTILERAAMGRRWRSYGSLAFPSNTKTYTIATGIPLPAALKFRMNKIVNMFLSEGMAAGAADLIYKYDKTNHSIRVFRSAALAPAGSVAAPTFTGIAVTPAGTVAAPVFTGITFAVPTVGEAVQPAGTVSAPAFTGVALTPSGTVSAPALTLTAIAAAGLAEFTDNVALAMGTVTLYFDAIGS